jgi:hypothetical protein
MKLLFEIYRILRELGIKTKDIIGVGKTIQKTGTKLFKENIDPKILNVIYNKGTLSDKIKKIITEAAKGLRNTNAIEQRKFLVNIRKIKNSVIPEEAEVIDIATRAKLPASGIEKLKTQIQLDKNVLPFKTGEARWILDKALKEGRFEFDPAEIEMIKGGKGDILELFRSYFGSNAVRNLPAEGSINASSKFFKELTYAVDDSGFFVNHPKFNKEAIDWKKTRELIKEFGDTIEGHPYTTQSELRAAMRAKESGLPAKIEGPFPRLDPENDAFIMIDKDTRIGRYDGRVSADEVTGKSVTKWYDKWDDKNKKLLTDQSKYKFSGAVDETGKDIIEGVIEGEVISKEAPMVKDEFFRIKQGLSTQIKLNTLPQNKEFAKELISGKNAEFNSLDKAAKREVLDRLDISIKNTKADFAEPVKPEDLASGGRIGLKTGTAKQIINLVVKHGPAFKKFADGLFIKASNAIRLGQGIFKNLTKSQQIKQHDNLVKAITTFEKKGTLEGTEQYFGIEAEKAFIAARAKIKKTGPEVSGIDDALKSDFEKAAGVKEVSKVRTMDDLVEDAYNEVFFQKPRSGDYKYDADILATEIAYQGGKIYDDLAAVEKAGIYDLAYKRVIKDLKTRMDLKKGVADVMKDTSEAGLKKSIETDNLKLEFPGISDEMIENILTDMNPQRIAEVKQTMREALKMQEKMSVDDIIDTFKRTPKTKQASGGRIGYRDGTILPEPKPEEVYLDKRLEKLQRAKKTILDNPGAFVDEEGKFTGEALIESINNDIAQLRKEYVAIEKIPGLATGGVSNLFRKR